MNLRKISLGNTPGDRAEEGKNKISARGMGENAKNIKDTCIEGTG